MNWKSVGRIILKAGLLFIFLNLLFATLSPLPALGQLSLYGRLWHLRERLPYGENPAQSNNLTLNNIPAMFASHLLSREKAADEYRVILLGDSGIWGWLLENEETLAGQLNRRGLTTADGREIVVYNLGYPIMSASKDLLILSEALKYEPDLILWPITLESLAWETQLDHPILQNNPERMRQLIKDYRLNLNAEDARFVDPDFSQQTIVGQRRALADLMRLQQLGLAWSATGVDQAMPAELNLRRSDFEADESWQQLSGPAQLTQDDLALSLLSAGITLAGDVPVILINEPIFISDGQNSELRYNAWYPRWAYDQYRDLLAAAAGTENWNYIDLWDTVSPENFTDSPVHLNPDGSAGLAADIQRLWQLNQESLN